MVASYSAARSQARPPLGLGRSSDTYNPSPGVLEGVPAARGYEGGFGHELMLKDLRLALQAAADAGAPAPSCAHALRLYELSAAAGMAGKDFGGVFQYLAERDGPGRAS